MSTPSRDTRLSVSELDTLTRRFLDLEANRKRIEDEQAGIKARLRHALAEGSHQTPSGSRVTISPNRKFSPTLAASVIPAELRQVVEVTVIDAKKAKNLLPPALYEACKKNAGDPRVVIA